MGYIAWMGWALAWGGVPPNDPTLHDPVAEIAQHQAEIEALDRAIASLLDPGSAPRDPHLERATLWVQLTADARGDALADRRAARRQLQRSRRRGDVEGERTARIVRIEARRILREARGRYRRARVDLASIRSDRRSGRAAAAAAQAHGAALATLRAERNLAVAQIRLARARGAAAHTDIRQLEAEVAARLTALDQVRAVR